MRPDEHKKKRSAQYQRKHGKAKGKDENEGKLAQKPAKDKVTSASSKNDLGGRTSSNWTQEKRRADKTVGKNKNDTSSSGSDGEVRATAEESKKTYRKREISSNWAKYEPPATDDSNAQAEPKGEDFNKLLASAGHAVAHFRFKEEQAWEENGEEGGSTSENAAQQLLTLDCAQLASSLACIPLYKVLHLDTSIFMPSQITSMDSEAAKHRETYMGGVLPSASSQSLISTLTSRASETVSNTSTNFTGMTKSCDSSPVSSKTLNTEGILLKENTSKKCVHTSGERKACNVSMIPQNTESTLTSENGTGGEVSNFSAVFPVSSDTEKEVRNMANTEVGALTIKTLDQELDDILNEVPEQRANQSQCGLYKATQETIAKESDELEDWLDVILDS